jgi:glycosyltransferase involved in cell wall biosynthesis
MKISIVIPTYNMAHMLRQGLSYLAAQEPVAGLEYEAIVIDDGSADDTRAVAEEFSRHLPSLEYRFLPRGPRSCRAAARNAGIEAARGELLVFLDSGIAVSPRFLALVAAQLTGAAHRVLLHPVHGIIAGYDTKHGSDTSPLASLSPATFDATCARLRQLPDWEDPRDAFFNLCGETVDRLPAPWALGWTTALSLHRALAVKVGGFDVGFQGWGMEDTEFSYRLHSQGASFMAAREAPVVHLPHAPLSTRAEKERSHLENTLRMHRKHRTLESELCCLVPGPYINQFMAQLEYLISESVTGQHSPGFLQEVAARYLTGDRPSLAVGLDSLAAAHHLPVTHMLAHNEHLRARLGERFPGRTILRLLGLHTLLPDKSFEVALATDFIRMLPQGMIQAMAKELCRIAGQALLLCHPALESLISEEGLPFVSFQNLASILDAAGLRLEERLVRDGSALYALLPSSAS